MILRHWKTLLKITFVVGLLWFLGKKGFLSFEATKRAFTNLDILLPAMALLMCNLPIAVIRWQWLLRAQGLNISWPQAFRLTMVGNFFNIALPGAVSGDFVKAYYVAREVGGRRGHVFGAILFDRITGLSALVLVSAAALALDLNGLKGSALLHGVRYLVITAALGVIFFFSYLFLVREHHDPLLRIFRWLETKNSKIGSITRIYEGTRHYHAHRWVVLKSLAVSLVIHAIVCFSCIQFAQALGETSLPGTQVFVVVPLGLLVTAVPVLPGGVGTGHAAFGWLFHFLGSLRGADIFSLFVLNQFFFGGIGGLFYLRFKNQVPPLPENAEIEPA
jgi:uncharacterized protein (TIRG00374 family)